jgi:hypothetical protein
VLEATTLHDIEEIGEQCMQLLPITLFAMFWI